MILSRDQKVKMIHSLYQRATNDNFTSGIGQNTAFYEDLIAGL